MPLVAGTSSRTRTLLELESCGPPLCCTPQFPNRKLAPITITSVTSKVSNNSYLYARPDNFCVWRSSHLSPYISNSGHVYLLALACRPAQTGFSLASLSPPHASAAGEVSYAPDGAMSSMRRRGKQHPHNTKVEA